MDNTNLYASEPIIYVGIMAAAEINFELKGNFLCNNSKVAPGAYLVKIYHEQIHCQGIGLMPQLSLIPIDENATFVLKQVTIGIGFHWEQKEDQEFEGGLSFLIEGNVLRAVNMVPLERYLKSVISSEMSAMNDHNLLYAHAIVSRSWLLAQINRKNLVDTGNLESEGGRISQHAATAQHTTTPNEVPNQIEIVRWYDREDHSTFDVCADDHCQRYQGITKVISERASKAVEASRGLVLAYQGKVCDARFSKCCGGISEDFENVWQAIKIPYLVAVRDIDDFITSSPEAFCNTSDPEVLGQVLIDFDRSTTNFYRWTVEYKQNELAALIARKSGIDFGAILDLEPMERGKSGRIIRLKIVGEKQTVVVGKELEIRKWLSDSHLFSSAFVVEKEDNGEQGFPSKFVLNGSGWGHGVGMCQIGAAVMSRKGFTPAQILRHYFSGATIERLYV